MPYVYHLVNPITNLPFYVGKGSGDRAYKHLTDKLVGQNPLKDSEIQSIRNNGLEPIVKIIQDNLSEREALVLEAREILKYLCRGLDKDGILTNRSLGGFGGDVSSSFTSESRKKMSRAKSASRNPNAKLTQEEVVSIYTSTQSTKVLAEQYGIDSSSVLSIKRRKTYCEYTQHLGDPGQSTSRRRVLSTEKVREIYTFTGTPVEFMERFGVSVTVARNIKNRVTYSAECADLGEPGEIRLRGLTWSEVCDIRRSNQDSSQLASQYGTSEHTINEIRLGRTRKFS